MERVVDGQAEPVVRVDRAGIEGEIAGKDHRVGASLRQGLAGVLGLKTGQLLGVLENFRGQGLQQVGADFGLGCGPVCLRGMGGLHGLVDVRGVATEDRTEDISCRGVDVVVGGVGGDVFAVDVGGRGRSCHSLSSEVVRHRDGGCVTAPTRGQSVNLGQSAMTMPARVTLRDSAASIASFTWSRVKSASTRDSHGKCGVSTIKRIALPRTSSG